MDFLNHDLISRVKPTYCPNATFFWEIVFEKFFGRIFWEEFFGRNSLFHWNWLVCQDFVAIKKEEGQEFRSLEVRRKLLALKNGKKGLHSDQIL